MIKGSSGARWYIPVIFLLLMVGLFLLAGYDVLKDTPETKTNTGQIIAAVVKPVIGYWMLMFLYIGLSLLTAVFALAATKKEYKLGFKNAFILTTVVLAIYILVPFVFAKI
jgi:hypothetical protein